MKETIATLHINFNLVNNGIKAEIEYKAPEPGKYPEDIIDCLIRTVPLTLIKILLSSGKKTKTITDPTQN